MVSAGVGTMTPACCDGLDTFFSKFDVNLFDDEMDESYEGGLKIAENLADSGNETFLEERNL